MRRRLPCIQGLMMYATVKYSGGHMRKTWALRCGRNAAFDTATSGARSRSLTAKAALQVGREVDRILQSYRQANHALDDAGLFAFGRRDAPVRRGGGMADR